MFHGPLTSPQMQHRSISRGRTGKPWLACSRCRRRRIRLRCSSRLLTTATIFKHACRKNTTDRRAERRDGGADQVLRPERDRPAHNASARQDTNIQWMEYCICRFKKEHECSGHWFPLSSYQATSESVTASARFCRRLAEVETQDCALTAPHHGHRLRAAPRMQAQSSRGPRALARPPGPQDLRPRRALASQSLLAPRRRSQVLRDSLSDRAGTSTERRGSICRSRRHGSAFRGASG